MLLEMFAEMCFALNKDYTKKKDIGYITSAICFIGPYFQMFFTKSVSNTCHQLRPKGEFTKLEWNVFTSYLNGLLTIVTDHYFIA